MNKLLLFFSCVSLLSSTYAQNYRFNQYTTENGISQNFIYTINQDEKGYLWIGTGEGVCKFDGRIFNTFSTSDGITEDVITASYFGSSGTIILGHNGGGISKGENGIFSSIAKGNGISSTIKGIVGFDNQLLFISQNEGVFEIRNDRVEEIGKFGESLFYSIEMLDDENLILGTSNGLLHLSKESGDWIKKKNYLKGNEILTISKSSNRRIYNVGTASGVLYQIKLQNKKIISRSWEVPILKGFAINSIALDENHDLWIGTSGNGLVKILNVSSSSNLAIVHYNQEKGLSSNHVQKVFLDREGTIWIGTFGEGLSSLSDDFFTFYNDEFNEENASVTSILIDQDNRWVGTDNGLILMNNKTLNKKFYTDTSGFVNDKITGIHKNINGIWVSTATKGLFKFNKEKNKFKKIEFSYGILQNKINEITGEGNLLWCATQGGLISYDYTSDKTEIYGTEHGLGHNAIQTVLEDHNGDLWIGTYSRSIYRINDNGLEEFELLTMGQLEVVSIVEDFKKNIWIATAESGVFRIHDKTISHFSKKNGLKSNYTYSIHNDVNNNVWVGHQGGLSKINEESQLVTTYGNKIGIKGLLNKRTMALDNDFNLWIGGENGAIKYDAKKEKVNIIPPVINIIKVWIGDSAYAPNELIELPFDNYRIRFEYVGISFKDSEKITYKFMLDGHDQRFSDSTYSNIAVYGKVSDGEYEFSVQAYNANGFISENEAKIKIIIRPPFWKRIWFIALISILSVLLLIGFIKYREKKLKDQQEYLEEQLKIKTKEVVIKAKKIEEINTDLTDSINYAKGIQNSLMSNQEIFQDSLPGSFIFFKPRDIVSGDFYFMERIGNKLIVACVDCTGHGVPGAFVSVIGSVALATIYSLSTKEWKTPEQVLELLDKDVKNFLQSNSNEDINPVSTDGMDMTLCEINLDTNEVLLASARRRSILVQNGKLHDIHGDKRSIGGDNLSQSLFTLQKFNLEKGDELYLFTDGYTDQFGGAKNKKLMVSGTRKIIQGLESLKRQEYQESVKSNFELWKADYDQTDDVLFMGLMF